MKYKRMVLTSEEREMLLRKSDGKCSHCGKPLTLDTVTCDHVIPISRGSDNNYKNMVALCKECNKEKADRLITDSMGFYYRYLKPNYLKQLIGYAEEYLKNTKWLSYDNFTPSHLSYYIDDCYISNTNYLKYKDKHIIGKKVALKKAVYSDLNNILEYWYKLHRNNKECREPISKEDIKRYLTIGFTTGAIYFLENSDSEIVGTYSIGFWYSSVFDGTFIPVIQNISCKKAYKRSLARILANQVYYLQENLGVSNGVIEARLYSWQTHAKVALLSCSFKEVAEAGDIEVYMIRLSKNVNGAKTTFSTKCVNDMLKRESNICAKYADDLIKNLSPVLGSMEVSK